MTKTLFMIHGMWGQGAHWSNWRSFFEAKGWHCLTPTLRYHDPAPGAPPDPALGTTSLRDYVADLERDIRALEEPPVIIGHSMGGLLAQLLAARGLGRRTVLLHSAAPAGVLVLSGSVLRSFASCLTRWGFWRKPHLATLTSWSSPPCTSSLPRSSGRSTAPSSRSRGWSSSRAVSRSLTGAGPPRSTPPR